ncbi:DUF7539 family protein [Haloarchaeobius sp. DFWS5]|uniref:DUF7539 family protein n=1 Tax=Haloarchaeobius sp. DFWS5 TaxID=3446114 RepID=UPI003EBAAB10
MELVRPNRALLQRAREQMDGWIFDGRDRAFDEMFEGPGAVVSGEELQQLDRIDSALSRQTGVGIWGADQYGIITGHFPDDVPLRVVCTLHPEIPAEGYRGHNSLEESTRDRYNDVLFEYCERVATFAQADLEAFVLDVEAEADTV